MADEKKGFYRLSRTSRNPQDDGLATTMLATLGRARNLDITIGKPEMRILELRNSGNKEISESPFLSSSFRFQIPG